MTTPPQVSIILPTYNRPDDLRETLRQIRENVRLPHEVLILDNSDDVTSLDLGSNEKHLFIGRNEGTAARNRGIRLARAPYLLMLDDDSHPQPRAVETALASLMRAPGNVAGLLGNVQRPDGTVESTLLPTTLLGCGVLLKRDVMKGLSFGYPEDFRFYGEEYWITLALYRSGYHLDRCDDLRILHRASSTGRDKARIFYHLGRNNAVIWQQFTPSCYLGRVLEDTNRRYEYIADREGVREAFDQGRSHALTPQWPVAPLTLKRFRAFSLIDRFTAVARQGRAPRGAVLCGAGKFPGLWAEALHSSGVPRVFVADFNPALIGESFGEWPVLASRAALALGHLGYTFITGHASTADNARWRGLLAKSKINPENVVHITGRPGDSLAAPMAHAA